MEAKDKDKKSKKKVESEDEDEKGSEGEEEEEEETFDKTPAMLEKYKTAARITDAVMKYVILECVPGADIADICSKGDKMIDKMVFAHESP